MSIDAGKIEAGEVDVKDDAAVDRRGWANRNEAK
jgi:hypothetical protein